MQGFAASSAPALYEQIVKLSIDPKGHGPKNPHQLCEVLLRLVEQLRLCGQDFPEPMLVYNTLNKVDCYLMSAKSHNVHDQQYLQGVASICDEAKRFPERWTLQKLHCEMDACKHKLEDAQESARAAADDGKRYTQFISSILDCGNTGGEHVSRKAKKQLAARALRQAQKKRDAEEEREAEEATVHAINSRGEPTSKIKGGGTKRQPQQLFQEKDRWTVQDPSKPHCPCCGSDHRIGKCRLFCRNCGPNKGHTTADCRYQDNRICFWCQKREKECKGTADEHKPPNGQNSGLTSDHCYANCPSRKRGEPRASAPQYNKAYFVSTDGLSRADAIATSHRAWDFCNADPQGEDETTEPILLTRAQCTTDHGTEPLKVRFEEWQEVDGDSETVYFTCCNDRQYLVDASAKSGAAGINAQYAGRQLGSAFSSNMEGDGPRSDYSGTTTQPHHA